MARHSPAWVRGAWFTLLFLSAILVLLPLPGGGDETGLRLAGWFPGFLAGSVERSYLLVKLAMPWLAVGALLSLIWSPPAIRAGAVGLAAGCFLAGWVLLPDFGWSAARDLLFALPGLAVGLWLGEHTAQPAPLQSGRRGASQVQGAAASQAQGRFEKTAIPAEAGIHPLGFTPQSPQDQPARHAASHTFSPEQQPSTRKPEPATEANEADSRSAGNGFVASGGPRPGADPAAGRRGHFVRLS